MADFVLVHGAWHGAWCWKKVLPSLWANSHRAFAVSLTGVGERALQLSPSIRLQTHVDDVLAVIEAEELSRAILVGHSYGGLLITAAAAQVPERIAHLVYVDAIVAYDGESWSSIHDEQTRSMRREGIARTGVMPPMDPAAYGLTGEDAAWVRRRQRPHPGGMYDDALHIDAKLLQRIARTFVDCSSPALPTVALSRRRARSDPGWNVVTLETGHDPMISAPAELLRVLDSVAASAATRVDAGIRR
jgi:pimeloyl-ACP methyl ester carboxylesterase